MAVTAVLTVAVIPVAVIPGTVGPGTVGSGSRAGVIVEVAAVIWSTRPRLGELLDGTGAPGAGGSPTRDVEVAHYLRLGLDLVGVGAPLLAAPGTLPTPGWTIATDAATVTLTVTCPDRAIAVTGPGHPWGPQQPPVTDRWRRALARWQVALLLTGTIPFTDHGVDLTAAARSGGLLRGIARRDPGPDEPPGTREDGEAGAAGIRGGNGDAWLPAGTEGPPLIGWPPVTGSTSGFRRLFHPPG